VKQLNKQHYSAGAASTSGEAGAIAIEDVEHAVPAYVKKLGPASERWVMVVFLNDAGPSSRSTGSVLFGGGTSVVGLDGFCSTKTPADLYGDTKVSVKLRILPVAATSTTRKPLKMPSRPCSIYPITKNSGGQNLRHFCLEFHSRGGPQTAGRGSCCARA